MNLADCAAGCYTAQNLVTTNDSWARIPGIGKVSLLSLVNARFLVRNWDDTCDLVWVVCIHQEVLSEEIITLLYEDGNVMTADLDWFLNSIVN